MKRSSMCSSLKGLAVVLATVLFAAEGPRLYRTALRGSGFIA